MIILELVFSACMLILMPFLMIFGLFAMCWVGKWVWIFCGVLSGNKEVIYEFDCRDKKPWSFENMVEDMLLDDRNYRRRLENRKPPDVVQISWRDRGDKPPWNKDEIWRN